MRIEKLAENKIAVTLTSDELSGMDINVHTLNYDRRVLNAFLIRVMEIVRRETGFNPYNGQIVVEARTTLAGMTVIVSKIGAAARISRKALKNAKHISAKVKEPSNMTQTFFFDSFDDVCSVLERIDEEMYSDLALYKDDKAYYILFGCRNLRDDNKEKYFTCASMLCEYCERTSLFSMYHWHVREHAGLVAEGKELASMAQGIKTLYER